MSFALASSSVASFASAKGFNVAEYVGEKASSATSFALKETHIEKLPFISKGVVDIYDTSIDAEHHGGYRLVLRLSSLRKTFYIVNKKRKFTKKIAAWSSRPEDGIYADGFTGLKQVREQFKSLIAETEATKDDTSNVSEMTIKDYLLTRYTRDRETTTIKSGVIKPVRKETIAAVISALEPWMNFKISQAKETWPQEFKDYWKDLVKVNPSNGKETLLKEDTMRQYYTALNAMFSICVKRGYIAKNKIDGHIHLFKRTKNEKIVVYEYDYEDVLTFIFSDQVQEKLSHKLIVASMIVTGARNSEIYMNYSENFRIEKREIFIPGEISKNKNVNRTVPVESDLYWLMVAEYLNELELNKYGHMFPSKKAKDGHVTDNTYRDVWEAVKKKYNLKKHARLYNNRSTYGTRLAKEHSIEIAAKMIGDSLETTAKYYLHTEPDIARGSLKKMFNKTEPSSASENSTSVENRATTDDKNTRAKIQIGKLPECVNELFEQFLGGKDAEVLAGKVEKDVWVQFISKIAMRVQKGKASREEEDWFELVS